MHLVFFTCHAINSGSFDLICLTINWQEELDVKVLKFQNAKLFVRLEEKNAQEEDFKARIFKLERVRENDQNIISLMNVGWNQVRVMM